MSSNSKPTASTSSNEDSATKSSSTDQDSHKITNYFHILRGEGRAEMCAAKTADSKQKEILQKLKGKETRSLRSKSEDKKEAVEDVSKQEPLATKEKLRGSISVMSALKTPLSQVLRKSIETSDKREQGDKNVAEKTKSQVSKKDQSTSENETDDKPKIQKARKSMPESESGMALRQKSAQSNKSVVSSLRSQAKKGPETKTTPVTRRKVADSGDSAPSKSGSKASSVSASSSPVVTASLSPIEDAEHGTSNQSSASGGKGKKNRKRHFRGGTYSLFLSKKRKRLNMKQKSFEESRDDECSLAGTENSSFFDSEDGNSMMSEDLYTPSEKSLPDEEMNQESSNFPISEVKNESNEGKEVDDMNTDNAGKMSPKEEDRDLKADFDSQEPNHQSSPKTEKSDEPSEVVSNFPFKKSPSECMDRETNDINSSENNMSIDDSKVEKVEETNEIKLSEDVEKDISVKDEDSNPASVTQEKSPVYSSGQEDDESPASMVSSGDEQDSENLHEDDNSERGDPNDAQSTIATCVKSRQRIKRRFTDDVVDTDVGLLTLNSSMAPPRKNPYKPDPPKDVIQTFQSVTRSEAKKLCLTKIECIYNSHQDPIKTCTCEGETYDANLGDDDEGVFCQAVDSIDDKLVGCSNPVVTPKLVRPSVKVPFTIMCEMHLWRLRHHHSCPYCGLFCSQGSFMQCTNSKSRRAVHLYHEQCQSKEEGIEPFCFHCGVSSGMKRVTLEMHMASPPSFFLSQVSKIPALNGEKARISFSSSAEIAKKEEEAKSGGVSYRIKDTGRVLSSVGLTKGPESENLDRLLLSMGQDTGEFTEYSSEDFYLAASEGDLLKMLNMLAQGIDPNQVFKNHENETALHTAAANGHTTIVHLLIQAGAVNDTINERIYTPLMLAAESNHKDVVFYLVKNGAGTDFKGETGMSSFHIAAKNGNLDILKILLSSRDVDVNSQDDGGWTPIVWASEHDHYDVVKYLLMRGANPNIRDSEGNTGLHWSAFSGSVDISFLYLDFGCDINGVNERGDTPLHIAARQDSLPCVTLFLSRGADVQIKNKSNQTPAECVIDKNSDTYLSLSLNMLLKRIAGKYQHKAEKIIHKDISRGKEQIAIQVVNDVDDEPPPLDFLYVTENCETTPMNIDRTITSLQSCHCEDDCSTASCTCASISYQCWYDKEGLLLPNFNLLDPPMLFECNRACSCWSLNCRNRVLQNGMTCRLQLIRTKGKGWGVRTLKDIPKGTFICEYVGEMISDSAADKRADDSYLFDLDNRDGETYCLDARYYGNISRFINHLCEPNLVPVKVYVDHQDLNFPRIAFFSSRDIKQYEELGFDYCEKFWVIKYKYFTCDCGSPKCKYSKDTIHTTLANYYRRVREEQMEEASLQTGVQEPLVNSMDNIL